MVRNGNSTQRFPSWGDLTKMFSVLTCGGSVRKTVRNLHMERLIETSSGHYHTAEFKAQLETLTLCGRSVQHGAEVEGMMEGSGSLVVAVAVEERSLPGC
ncbi:unnamed protein product [Pleuronectes platessa]|uniref:Uncharacterized protein n=1 Tax=Pleuronectes platessa TaxID=8262 RepID=A0A9N7YL64_PLEPL|nr:unnamed protein product [Pleuronectes platessa]